MKVRCNPKPLDLSICDERGIRPVITKTLMKKYYIRFIFGSFYTYVMRNSNNTFDVSIRKRNDLRTAASV